MIVPHLSYFLFAFYLLLVFWGDFCCFLRCYFTDLLHFSCQFFVYLVVFFWSIFSCFLRCECVTLLICCWISWLDSFISCVLWGIWSCPNIFVFLVLWCPFGSFLSPWMLIKPWLCFAFFFGGGRGRLNYAVLCSLWLSNYIPVF